MSSGERPVSEAHEYFRTIEEVFIGLRGAPLLLSPADWQIASEWHHSGIPLGVVCEALEELFARRRERGETRPVNGLRYCRHAVEAAWEERRELEGGSARPQAETLDIAGRLQSLAESLPATLRERERLAERVLGLDGSAEQIEERLSALDDELMEAAQRQLDPALRSRIEERVEAALARLASRIPASDAGEVRARLTRRETRRALGLPLLSLFAPPGGF